MKKYRILQDIFGRVFIEKKKLFRWRRFDYLFDSVENAEKFIKKEGNIGQPWIVKKVNIITNYLSN